EQPVPELRIILVGVEQGVGAVGSHHLAFGEGCVQPPVVGLSCELEDPARHRDGDTVGGELFHERVVPFPGRFAWDRYAAARRRTSFSCSSNRIRFRASRNSVASALVWPGLAPVST